MKQNNGQIDIFDAAYFESILPKNKRTNEPLWTKQAIQGEWCYLINFGVNDARILVRSSISVTSNVSRSTGKDSIRSYVVGRDLKPLLGKNKRWSTRVAGWEDRLWADLSKLRERFNQVYNQIKCPKCGKLLPIYVNKKDQEYIKCWSCDGDNGWDTYKVIK